jgi:hypothetical protein
MLPSPPSPPPLPDPTHLLFSMKGRILRGEWGGGSSAQSTYIGRDEIGSVYLPTQLERTLQLYW